MEKKKKAQLPSGSAVHGPDPKLLPTVPEEVSRYLSPQTAGRFLNTLLPPTPPQPFSVLPLPSPVPADGCVTLLLLGEHVWLCQHLPHTQAFCQPPGKRLRAPREPLVPLHSPVQSVPTNSRTDVAITTEAEQTLVQLEGFPTTKKMQKYNSMKNEKAFIINIKKKIAWPSMSSNGHPVIPSDLQGMHGQSWNTLWETVGKVSSQNSLLDLPLLGNRLSK